MVYDRAIGYNNATGKFEVVIMNVTANGLTPDNFIGESSPQYSGQVFRRWYNGREAARIDKECRAIIRIVGEIKELPPIVSQQEALFALHRIRQLPAGAQIMMLPFSKQLEGMIATSAVNIERPSLDARLSN